jgi:hypothetical protein
MKHLADHRATSTGARMAHFLRLKRREQAQPWQLVFRKPALRAEGNPRLRAFLRIDRGRET